MISLLIVLPFAVALAVLMLAARRGRRRAAPVPAFRPRAPAETRHAVTVLPDPGPEREPFGFDAGLMIGDDGS